MLLKYCEVCLRAGIPDRARPFLRKITWIPTDWKAQQLTRLLGVAERMGEHGLAALVLRAALARKSIPLKLARHLLRLAKFNGDMDFAVNMSDVIARKVPRSARWEFEVLANSLLFGPETALDKVKEQPKARRTPKQALALAQLLLFAGERRTLLRYLRFCRIKWPHSLAFARLLVQAYGRFGEPQKALDLQDEIECTWPNADLRRQRIELLIENEDIKAALTLVENSDNSAIGSRDAKQLLRLYISTGRFEDAMALVPNVAAATGRGEKSVSQFRATHVGSMLNEALLFQSAGGDVQGKDPTADPRVLTDLARQYYFPAARMLDEWQSRQPAPVAPPSLEQDIPQRIFQYWDSNIVPRDVSKLMLSWQNHDRYEYNLLHRNDAISFLNTHFGADHVRAFKMANHVAEECDFLRLCLLYAKGGMYADADDKLIDSPDRLNSLGRGIVLFREPFGAISNNVMLARPRHRLVEIAIDMARDSLLSRENDTTWAKTGPGLMTRAAALYIRETPSEVVARDFSLLPRHVCRRRVQIHVPLPYKATKAYWNDHDGQAPEQLVKILGDALNAGT
ncbi:glycosyltransferase family 32 protein [Sedimentitalea todarodis]|uniref:Glycosyltransferase n=1 Tax=Sedimentitalea todarodis TaxID=1631240 RepID=A0ABU3VDR5_9RHOB|nr:glycosyltransferase [Sedimentitalea todarodis]MDU9004313.1 glycosyltransferase [Sedimentitalea todarodis]